MGADLYIQCEIADEYDELWRDEFDKAVKDRDDAITQYGAERDTEDPFKFKDPHVQEKQDKVNEFSNKLWDENPYYFRDSYNATSIFWQLGLSWWEDVGNLLNEQNKNLPELGDNATDEEYEKHSTLNAESCRELLTLINEAADSYDIDEITKEWLENNNCKVESDDDVQEWKDYFLKKLQNLREFVQLGIDTNAGIYCST